MKDFSKILTDQQQRNQVGFIRKNPEGWGDLENVMKVIKALGCQFDPRFVIDSDNREVYTNLIYWLMNDSRMMAIDPRTGKKIPGRLNRGIYLAGNTGSGKTLAMTIIRRMYEYNPVYNMMGSALEWHEAKANLITDWFAFNGNTGDCRKYPLFCIQDLGCEPAETVYMGNRSNVIQSIIEYRGDRPDLITLATSNIPMGHQDLRARYGERATSRMMEMMNYLILTGKDRRQNI